MFRRIICIIGRFTAITTVIILIFQFVEQKGRPPVLYMLRKGGLEVPFMFLLNFLGGANAIAWATPIEYCGAVLAGMLLFVPLWRKMWRE